MRVYPCDTSATVGIGAAASSNVHTAESTVDLPDDDSPTSAHTASGTSRSEQTWLADRLPTSPRTPGSAQSTHIPRPPRVPAHTHAQPSAATPLSPFVPIDPRTGPPPVEPVVPLIRPVVHGPRSDNPDGHRQPCVITTMLLTVIRDQPGPRPPHARLSRFLLTPACQRQRRREPPWFPPAQPCS